MESSVTSDSILSWSFSTSRQSSFSLESKAMDIMWASFTPDCFRCSLNRLKRRYDFPHPRTPVTIFTMPLCFLAMSLRR